MNMKPDGWDVKHVFVAQVRFAPLRIRSPNVHHMHTSIQIINKLLMPIHAQMYVCVYMCVYIYIYIHIHTYLYIHISTKTHLYHFIVVATPSCLHLHSTVPRPICFPQLLKSPIELDSPFSTLRPIRKVSIWETAAMAQAGSDL